DAGLSLYHYRARMYDPAIGRFCSRDPIGFEAKDLNLYRYVGDEPLKYVDPLGLDRDIQLWPKDTDKVAVNYQFAALIKADCDGLSVEDVWVEQGGLFTILAITWEINISNPQLTSLT